MAQGQVVVLDSITQDLFICGCCKTIFYTLQSFLDHKRLQCVEELISVKQLESHCTYPPPVTYLPTENGINNEILSDKKLATEFNISCVKCKKKFKKTKYLLAHMKLHDKPYQCRICGRCFDNSSHLKRHTASHRVWPDSLNATTAKTVEVELLSYTCSYCDSVLSNYSQFRAHLNNHLSIKKFKCIQSDCNSFFETSDALLKHVSFEHNDPNYMCYLCKKYFQSLEDIASHYQNHNQVENVILPRTPKFKCSQCDAAFNRPDKLSLHLLNENHNKPCIHCSKTFISSKRLRMHLQIHKKSKPYQCTLCNSSFHMKKYLNSHMLKHGEGQFVCGVCKKNFRRQDVLHRHMKTHLARKSFACPFKDFEECKMEFSRKDKLREHMRSHARSLKCSGKKKKPTDSTDLVEICILPLNDSNITINDTSLAQ